METTIPTLFVRESLEKLRDHCAWMAAHGAPLPAEAVIAHLEFVILRWDHHVATINQKKEIRP